jgi:hypothetical protein
MMKLAHHLLIGMANHLASRRRLTARTEQGAVDEKPRSMRGSPSPRPTKRPTARKRPTQEEIDRTRGYVSKLGGQART